MNKTKIKKESKKKKLLIKKMTDERMHEEIKQKCKESQKSIEK